MRLSENLQSEVDESLKKGADNGAVRFIGKKGGKPSVKRDPFGEMEYCLPFLGNHPC